MVLVKLDSETAGPANFTNLLVPISIHFRSGSQIKIFHFYSKKLISLMFFLPLQQDIRKCRSGYKVSPRTGRQPPQGAPTYNFAKPSKTIVHSSRMRTGHSLTICQGLLLGGGLPQCMLGYHPPLTHPLLAHPTPLWHTPPPL